MGGKRSTAVSDYLIDAKLAVEYAKSFMTVGASNKVSDIVRTGGVGMYVKANMPESFQNALGVDPWKDARTGDDSYSKVAIMRYEREETWGPRMYSQDSLNVDIMALDARTHGAGNCGEQSALAFVYLRDRGVRPIDWCHFADKGKDHAFVILNAAAKIEEGNFAVWSKDAVLCDPWNDKAELAIHLTCRWGTDRVISTVHFGPGGEGESFGGFGGMDSRVGGTLKK